MDAIDVIIPTYNAAAFLPDAVRSVEAQTLPREMIRLLIVDDGSHDDSLSVLRRLTASSRVAIDVIGLAKNGGPNRARNVGLHCSTSPFVYFMDADSILAPTCLESLLDAISTQPRSVAFAYSAFRRLWETDEADDSKWRPEDVFPGPYEAERLRRANYISMMSLVRRDALPADGFDEGVRRLQDWDLWLTLLRRGMTGAYVPEVLFDAYVRRDGISGDPEEYVRVRELVRQKHFPGEPDPLAGDRSKPAPPAA